MQGRKKEMFGEQNLREQGNTTAVTGELRGLAGVDASQGKPQENPTVLGIILRGQETCKSTCAVTKTNFLSSGLFSHQRVKSFSKSPKQL